MLFLEKPKMPLVTPHVLSSQVWDDMTEEWTEYMFGEGSSLAS